MTFLHIYLHGLLVIMSMMTILWILSILLKNVSIVDIFWGLGFVIVCSYFFIATEGFETRKILLLIMTSLWGLRLSGYIISRNYGKGEDFRYRKFRKQYGEHRYWWISFFQTFLLQGILMWLISAPLLGAQFYNTHKAIVFTDIAGIIFWIIGFTFEAGGDFQMARFRADPSNKGKVMDKGFWHLTRHPNYFGDSSVWWGYGLICIAAGSYIPFLGSILMTVLIIKVSGVALLEKSLKDDKPGYKEYVERTSSFIPWFPKEKITH
jgi:steroid 5-alpha reductase family enzyme